MGLSGHERGRYIFAPFRAVPPRSTQKCLALRRGLFNEKWRSLMWSQPTKTSTFSRISVIIVVTSFAVAHAQQSFPPSKMKYPVVLEFQSTPPRATPTPGSACVVAEKMVKLELDHRMKEVPDLLFAEDGVL